MLNKPTGHGCRLIVCHSDRIVDELSSDIKVVGDAVDANTLNDGIDLMASTSAFLLFRIEHDAILDSIEQTTAGWIGKYNLDVWKARFQEECNTRNGPSSAGTAHERIQRSPCLLVDLRSSTGKVGAPICFCLKLIGEEPATWLVS